MTQTVEQVANGVVEQQAAVARTMEQQAAVAQTEEQVVRTMVGHSVAKDSLKKKKPRTAWSMAHNFPH